MSRLTGLPNDDWLSGCLTVAQLPDAGHDVNFQRNAQSWFDLANEWSRFTLEHGGDDASCWSESGQAGGLRYP